MEIQKVHEALNNANGKGIIVAPLSKEAKKWLEDDGYKIGEAETPCGCKGHNTVEK